MANNGNAVRDFVVNNWRGGRNIQRIDSSYARATCSHCDWHGQTTPIRTAEGWAFAERDRDRHAATHAACC